MFLRKMISLGNRYSFSIEFIYFYYVLYNNML